MMALRILQPFRVLQPYLSAVMMAPGTLILLLLLLLMLL